MHKTASFCFIYFHEQLVWIDQSLEAGERLVLASASATLLLQHDLSLQEE